MKKLRILCDMDGVVVNLLEPWLQTYRRETGEYVYRGAIKDWKVGNYVKDSERLYQILHRPGFFDYLPPLPGAILGVKELLYAGHDVRFATAPPSADAARGKIEWVKRVFDLDQRHVVMTHDKHWLHADVIIDDRPETIKEWSQKISDSLVIAMAHPYNRTVASYADFYAESIWNTEEAWSKINEAISRFSKEVR